MNEVLPGSCSTVMPVKREEKCIRLHVLYIGKMHDLLVMVVSTCILHCMAKEWTWKFSAILSDEVYQSIKTGERSIQHSAIDVMWTFS